MEECVFCKIITKQIPANFLIETDTLIVIEDIRPSAEVHLLLVPKTHVPSVLELETGHNFLSDALEIAKTLIADKNIAKAYKLVFNGGKYQVVPHVHWHLLGGDMKGEAV